METFKICIISEEAYPYFKGGEGGGAELQMVLLAKNLVKRGHVVSFVTFGKTDVENEKIYGINVYNPYYNQKKGYTHFLPNKLLKYMTLLQKINADIYIQRSGPLTTPIISLFRKKFIFSVSNEATVSSHLKIGCFNDLKNIFRIFNIKVSDCIFCQTQKQKELLKTNSNEDCKVIRNIHIPSNYYSKNKSNDILWVGRLIKSKNAEEYLELAKRLPNHNFKMIGGLSYGDEDYYEEIKMRTEDLGNLEFLGHIPRDKIDRYYAESCLFINTSSREGFPNTFLESWANKTPVLSINFDPDNIITKYKLGLNSRNMDNLVENTCKLMKNKKLREEMGVNGFNYVNMEHNAEKIISRYEIAFKSLINKSEGTYE